MLFLTRNSMISFLAVLLSTLNVCSGQLLTDIPEAAQGIEVEQKLGDSFPLEAGFTNEKGERMVLGKLGPKSLPLMLTLNYSNCPGLCVAQLSNLADALGKIDRLEMGKDFHVVSISIDPRETNEKLAGMKQRYAASFRSHSEPSQSIGSGWHFLRGDDASIKKVANAVGFRYTYDAKNDRFNHASCVVLISPSGKITRYLFEVGYQPETLRLAAIEASEGRIGTLADHFLLSCFHYNPDEGKYSASARKLLAYAAGGFVIVGIALSIPFWIGYRNLNKNQITVKE